MPEVLTYLDPTFFVRISDADGNIRFFGAGEGDPAERALEGRFLASVVITENRGGNNSVQAQFTPPSEAVDQILGDPVFAPGNVIEAQWGYTEWGLRTVYAVTTVPDVAIGASVDITVNAQGLLYAAMRRSVQKVWREEPSDPKSPALSPLDIITEIAADKLGFDVNTEFVSDSFSETEKVWVQAGETDWNFIRTVANHYNHDVFLRGRELVVVDRNRAISEQAPVAAVFRRFAQIDVANNVYPLEEFTTQNAGDIQGLQVRGFMMKDVDPDEGDGATLSDGDAPGPIRADDSSAVPSDTGGVLGGRPSDIKSPFPKISGLFVDKAFDEEREAGAIVNVSPRERDVKRTLQANYEQNQITAYEAELRTIGLPFIYPAQMVRIEGVGKLFDKVYQVDEITHALDGSGYSMTVKLVSSDVVLTHAQRSEAKKALNKNTKEDPRTVIKEPQ